MRILIQKPPCPVSVDASTEVTFNPGVEKGTFAIQQYLGKFSVAESCRYPVPKPTTFHEIKLSY
jgi:hypothetical protein